MTKRLLVLLLFVAMTLHFTSIALADTQAWLRVAGENEVVLAASSDGTRFLLAEALASALPPQGRELKLRVLDKATGEVHALFFVDDPYLMLLADNLLYRSEPDDKKRAAFIEKNGGAAALVMRVGWQGWPELAGAGGDYLLLTSNSMPGYARVDTRTGETMLLNASVASMAADGSVLSLDRERGAMWLNKPDSTEAEVSAIVPRIEGAAAPVSMCLLSDGSAWLIERVTHKEQPQVEGKRVLVRDVFFVHYDADGRELRRVAAGGFDLSAGAPETLLYNEQTGMGVAYNVQYMMKSYLWTFGEGDDTAKALLPASLEPPALRRAERNTAVDELGYALSDVRPMFPLGLSADGAQLLIYDMDTSYLLALDLKTLEADVVLTDAELTALYDEQDVRSRFAMHMTMLAWNGENLLCGRTNPGGYALEIPYTDKFINTEE